MRKRLGLKSVYSELEYDPCEGEVSESHGWQGKRTLRRGCLSISNEGQVDKQVCSGRINPDETGKVNFKVGKGYKG